MKTRVLVLHPDSDALQSLTRLLERDGFEVEGALAPPSAEHLATRAFDAFLVSERAAGRPGESWRGLVGACPGAALLLTVPAADLGPASEALDARVDDLLGEPLDHARLRLGLRNALERRRLVRQVSALAGELGAPAGLASLAARSTAMSRTLGELRAAAASSGPLLLHGAVGGEQERVARAVHFEGPRAAQPFESIDCATAGGSVEATITSSGVIRRLAGGSLHLASAERLGAAELERLLGALTAQNVRPIFSTQIGATPTPMSLAALLGARPGLVAIQLPALAERAGDVPALAWSILRALGRRHGRVLVGLTDEALRVLESYGWPGDVRELEGVLERALLVESGVQLSAASLLDLVPGAGPRALGEGSSLGTGLNGAGGVASSDAQGAALANGAVGPILPQGTVLPFQELERRILLHALRTTGWNVQEAARRLKLGRATIYRKIDRYGLKREAG